MESPTSYSFLSATDGKKLAPSNAMILKISSPKNWRKK
jgi:hypothetical protein